MFSNGINILEELVINIISRVDVKSCIEMKLVSKDWNRSISSSEFDEQHGKNNRDSSSSSTFIVLRHCYAGDSNESAANMIVCVRRFQSRRSWPLCFFNSVTRQYKEIQDFQRHVHAGTTLYRFFYSMEEDDYFVILLYQNKSDQNNICMMKYSLKSATLTNPKQTICPVSMMTSMTLHIDRYLVWISKRLHNNWLCPEALFVYDTHNDSFKHIPVASSGS
ncbi:F-box/kelch-repeat protein [Senna tora]|uniref:F-box/kelch-repeat protein n=1 Tax=Senna tora TaxID=362788 RepID=A0A834XAM7_9FABA|nr:F-box/kelch-repeat protein [Senna tora]